MLGKGQDDQRALAPNREEEMKLTAEQLRARFPKMPEATVQMNAIDRAPVAKTEPVVSEDKPRLRQARGKKMNKTETDFFLHLQNLTSGKIRFNELRFELANNTHFKPDFTVDARTIYEAKGPWASRDAFVRLKVAARLWPEFTWFLATRRARNGGWNIQEIFP